MITCDQARQLLLEADSTDRPDSRLAMHLARCAECSATAATVERGSAELRRAYRVALESVPPFDPGMIASTARAAEVSRRVRTRRLAWWSLVPVAAAAAAIMLVTRQNDVATVRLAAPPPVVRPPAPPLSVVVPPGHNAIVFNTSNPDISVVWIY